MWRDLLSYILTIYPYTPGIKGVKEALSMRLISKHQASLIPTVPTRDNLFWNKYITHIEQQCDIKVGTLYRINEYIGLSLEYLIKNIANEHSYIAVYKHNVVQCETNKGYVYTLYANDYVELYITSLSLRMLTLPVTQEIKTITEWIDIGDCEHLHTNEDIYCIYKGVVHVGCHKRKKRKIPSINKYIQ